MFYECKLQNYMTKEKGGALAVFLASPIFQGLKGSHWIYCPCIQNSLAALY